MQNEDKYKLLEEIKYKSRALEFASEAMKNDKEIVLEALKNDGITLEFISENLRNDKEIVLEAIKYNSWNLEFASENLKSDKEVVLMAVKQNGRVLQFASEALKNDKEIVFEALKNDGRALEFVSENLRNDEEIVLKAINKKHIYWRGLPIVFAGEYLKKDKTFLKKVIKKDIEVFKHLDEKLKKDKEIILSYNESRGCINTLYEEIGIAISKKMGNSKKTQLINENEILQIKTIFTQFFMTVKDLSSLFKEENLIVELCQMFMTKSGDFNKDKMKIRLIKHQINVGLDIEGTLAHEIGHFIDNHLGRKINKKYASECKNHLAWEIATAFSKHRINPNPKSKATYLNSQIECFARAMQQYYYEKLNLDIQTIRNKDQFCESNIFNKKIKIKIDKLLKSL